MKIIIDERETLLYDRCVSLIKDENLTEKIEIVKQVLPIGDILLRSHDDSDFLIIERKSLSDLLASIKDGRYVEQSHRLIHSTKIPPHHIIYLVEGVLSQLNAKEKKIVYSAMTSMSIFKGFSVFRTSSLNESGDWIVSMTEKIGRELQKGNIPHIENLFVQEKKETNEEKEQNMVPQNYCHVVKKVKKENITPENIGEIILSQIPGISSVIAITIMKPFSSFPEFLKKIQENPDYLENMVIENNGKKRKINKTAIDSIRQYFVYENIVSQSDPSVFLHTGEPEKIKIMNS